jgi:hypothetical protein
MRSAASITGLDLVLEKDVKGKGGAELLPTEVGLGKKYVRKSLTDAFRNYLDSRQDWLANLIDFRDSLAHRIPLFIPPYVVPAPNIEKYKALEPQRLASLAVTQWNMNASRQSKKLSSNSFQG